MEAISAITSSKTRPSFAIKDGFVSEDSIGFVEGSILSEFLNFDDIYRKEFLKEINYPWKKSHAEIINIIETLLKYH